MTILKETDHFFSSVLPEKLIKILQDYDDFTANPAPSDVKSFGAYHLACKNALSHIVLLLRILQKEKLPQSEQDDDTQGWLFEARTAIADTEDDDMCSDIDGICLDMG